MTIDSYSVEVLQLYHPLILDMKQLFQFVLYPIATDANGSFTVLT